MEAAGGRKGGEVSEVGFGAVGFFRWMDGWMVGLLAMDGRMSAMSSIRVTGGSTNQSLAYVIVLFLFCFFYSFTLLFWVKTQHISFMLYV